MNVDYYREFIELARCLNFTEAASALHITQPALSKHITALEKEFGAELFKRDRRSTQLTEAGRVLFGAATDIVQSYDTAQSVIAELTSATPIRVDGVLYDNTVSSIISVCSVLLNDSHHVPVIFNHQEDAPLFDLLEQNEVDIIFAYDHETRLDEKGLVYKPLARAQFVAAVDKDHPLANRKEISIEDLKDDTFIKFVDQYSLSGWRRIESVCRAHGFEPKTRPILGRPVTSYATTPPDGGVLILQQNLRQIKYLSNARQLPCIPIVDEDAAFIVYYIYKKENEERLSELLCALEESKAIIFKHRSME